MNYRIGQIYLSNCQPNIFNFAETCPGSFAQMIELISAWQILVRKVTYYK